ncbi:MAG: hypothetical protein MJ188_10140 [Treponema sp.]|nr:hypothetical protein [Treponema sp.]
MKALDALEKLLPSYNEYYDVLRENIPSPFKAEAVFISHAEQYFLVRSAKLSDIDSTERIYFAAEEHLSEEALRAMAETAWTEGLKTVVPYYGHRNSDVSVIVFCDGADENVLKKCKKIKYSKSYKFTLFGWSNFKLVVVDMSTGEVASNYHGGDIKTFVKKFIKKCNAQNA